MEEGEKVELFDIEHDMGEMLDLSTEMPQKTSEMMKLLQEWWNATDANLPVENPNYDPENPFFETTDPER